MLQISRKYKKIYEVLCCVLLICINLMYQFNTTQWSIVFKIAAIVTFGIVCILFVNLNIDYKFQYKDLIIIALLIIMQVICLIFRDNDALLLLIGGVLFFFLDSINIIKIYLWNLLVTFIITAFASLIGIFPLKADGFYVFGFGYKNRIGFIIFSISLYIFVLTILKYKNKIATRIGYFLLFLTVFIEQMLQDRTASILLMLFIIIYGIHLLKLNNAIIKILIVSLPLILIIVSLYLTFNFSKYQWIYKLNDWLSWRIGLWNNDWNMFHLSLFPQHINSYFSYITDYGQFMTITALDGYFALGVLQHGIIFFVLSILALMQMLFFGLQNMNKQQEVIVCMVVIFILYSFSETIPVISYLCFLFPTALGFKDAGRLMENV